MPRDKSMYTEKNPTVGKVFIMIGLLISLFYYTVFLGLPFYLYGAIVMGRSDNSKRAKIIWILTPPILWWPMAYLVMVLMYKIYS